jgi:hypothetical protein
MRELSPSRETADRDRGSGGGGDPANPAALRLRLVS